MQKFYRDNRCGDGVCKMAANVFSLNDLTHCGLAICCYWHQASHYMNKWCLIISEILWYSHQSNVYTFKIATESSKDKGVKAFIYIHWCRINLFHLWAGNQHIVSLPVETVFTAFQSRCSNITLHHHVLKHAGEERTTHKVSLAPRYLFGMKILGLHWLKGNRFFLKKLCISRFGIGC